MNYLNLVIGVGATAVKSCSGTQRCAPFPLKDEKKRRRRRKTLEDRLVSPSGAIQTLIIYVGNIDRSCAAYFVTNLKVSVLGKN